MQRNNTTLLGPSKQKSVMLLLFAFLANSFNLSQALKCQPYFYLRKKLISHTGICSGRQDFTPLHLHTSTYTNTQKGVHIIGHWFIRPTVNPHGLGPISTHQESASVLAAREEYHLPTWQCHNFLQHLQHICKSPIQEH